MVNDHKKEPPQTCDDYWSQCRHCKSLWNRFHKYYTHGPPLLRAVERRLSRVGEEPKSRDQGVITAVRENGWQSREGSPVWDLRRDPPRDWHKPLHQGKPLDSQS